VHEIGIANAILETVEAECNRNAGARPCRVGIKIGEMSAVNPDALRFAFEMATRDTNLANLKLEIEICPLRHRCLDCGRTFEVTEFSFECPGCRSAKTECVGGDELQLAYLEVEDEARKA
jgi:hydrogenase nickel incorporation protein HypA/HybF